jgi:hypothetical protein
MSYEEEGMPMMPTQLPMASQIDNGVYEKIIDNNELIDELMHTLKGEIVDNLTNEIRTQGKAIVSEEAINWMVGRLLPYTSKIFSLSFLDEKTTKQIIYEFETELSLDLMSPENHGIEKKNRDYIKWLMVHAFQASIFKALHGETIKRILEQHHIQETTIKQEKEKQGFMEKITKGMKV